jgi:CMP/dCMP kinase
MTTVAIDGPAGAGKSSVARAIATTLGFRYLDTGAMYRGVALAALDRGVDLDDEVALAALLRDIALEVDGERVILDGRDVSTEIRRPDVTTGAARAARHVAVRAALAAAQRATSLPHSTSERSGGRVSPRPRCPRTNWRSCAPTSRGATRATGPERSRHW